MLEWLLPTYTKHLLDSRGHGNMWLPNMTLTCCPEKHSTCWRCVIPFYLYAWEIKIHNIGHDWTHFQEKSNDDFVICEVKPIMLCQKGLWGRVKHHHGANKIMICSSTCFCDVCTKKHELRKPGFLAASIVPWQNHDGTRMSMILSKSIITPMPTY